MQQLRILTAMNNSREEQALQALVYRSVSTGTHTNVELDRLLVDATVHNRMNSVTGALLYDGHRFLQYIEGPADSLARVLARIENSRKHAGLQVLFRGGVRQRHFWNWSMACRHADASLVQRLEGARWTERAHPHLLDESDGNAGLGMLSDFWQLDPPDRC